ncbi:MAG: HAD-IC family P-type ATPase, partial [Pseudomonadota bacterium]
LAIPVVQAVAGGRLFRAGIFLKEGAALEALAGIDTLVIDKTGTLTEGRPRLVEGPEPADTEAWALAAGLAVASRHPVARAIAAAAENRGIAPAPVEAVAELAGHGIEGRSTDGPLRLGRAGWAGVPAAVANTAGAATAAWVSAPGREPLAFRVEDALRTDAADTVARLGAAGLRVILLSGDTPAAAARAAAAAGIAEAHGSVTPEGKIAFVEGLKAEGAAVAMVGDGLNDAPALAAADVSLAPASAAGVSEAAAGIVYLGTRLAPLARALATARAARARMVENLWLAGLYNAVAVPLAVAGFATPLIAALAMSSSSILVTLNALRIPDPAREVP